MTGRTTWHDKARSVIKQIHDGLPADISFADRKRTVDAAYPFGVRQHWPYKAWLEARRAYLDRFRPDPPGPLFDQIESPLERARRRGLDRIAGRQGRVTIDEHFDHSADSSDGANHGGVPA